MLPPQFTAAHLLPISIEALGTHALQIRMRGPLGFPVIPRQFLLVVAVAGPLELRAHPGPRLPRKLRILSW